MRAHVDTREFSSSCFLVNLPPDKIADAQIEFYITIKKVVLVTIIKSMCFFFNSLSFINRQSFIFSKMIL